MFPGWTIRPSARSLPSVQFLSQLRISLSNLHTSGLELGDRSSSRLRRFPARIPAFERSVCVCVCVCVKYWSNGFLSANTVTVSRCWYPPCYSIDSFRSAINMHRNRFVERPRIQFRSNCRTSFISAARAILVLLPAEANLSEHHVHCLVTALSLRRDVQNYVIMCLVS